MIKKILILVALLAWINKAFAADKPIVIQFIIDGLSKTVITSYSIHYTKLYELPLPFYKFKNRGKGNF